MRQKIQRGSLASEDGAGVSLDLHDFRARYDKRPIVMRPDHSNLRIQRAEDLFGYRQSRANECLPGEDVSTRRRARWYHRRGSRVSCADILFQRAAHKVSNVTRIPIHRAPRNYEAPSSCDNRSCDLRSSMRCSASVASSPLMICSGARLRNVSSPSCLSLEAMAFCRPSISFLSRVFSVATSTVSEYAMRTSKVAVERTAPLFASNCWRGTIRSSDKTANLSIAPRFSRISAPAPASLVENSAATLFLGSSFSSARMLRSAVTTSRIAATSPIAFAFFQWSCASGNWSSAIDFAPVFCGSWCHSSSVKKGMNGCSSRNAASNAAKRFFHATVARSRSALCNSGFTHSIYQSQKSPQKN